MLTVRGLRKAYGDLEVLAGLDLEVPKGGWVSVLGPSGCGKSTLFHILGGLTPADAGEIAWNGTVYPHLRPFVAYMHQKDLLLPWRTVLENVLLPAEIARRPRREAEGEARRWLARLGLAGFEGAYPAQLSGGMRQRAALARTLLTGRPLWLLDEPLGALDALTRARLQGLLHRTWREAGTTVLLVTHDIEEALLLSDRVYVLSPRPARILEAVEVDVPHPRRPDDPRLLALRRHLWEVLGEGFDITIG